MSIILLLKMTETSGMISGVITDPNAYTRNIMSCTNSNAVGMSGGPIYSEWGGVKCYGVNIAGSPANNASLAVQIYEDLFYVIVDYME